MSESLTRNRMRNDIVDIVNVNVNSNIAKYLRIDREENASLASTGLE